MTPSISTSITSTTALLPLLADPSPCLRWLVLRHLLDRPADDAEVAELAALREDDPLVRDLVRVQSEDGSWQPKELAGNVPGGAIQATAQALTRLGFLGFGVEHPAVRRGADFLFGEQLTDGSWPLPRNTPDTSPGADGDGGYDVQSLQTSLPLRGLVTVGLAEDPRCERAFDWLLDQRLEDGAWPTGIAAGNNGFVAFYRRLPHSRWGCRCNTTAALICFAHHPTQRTSPAARRALDLVLARETRETHHVGYDVARSVGAEPASGWITSLARFDLCQILDLCGRVGLSAADARVASIVDFLRGRQGALGLWPYDARPQATRWVSYAVGRGIEEVTR